MRDTRSQRCSSSYLLWCHCKSYNRFWRYLLACWLLGRAYAVNRTLSRTIAALVAARERALDDSLDV